MHKNVINSAWMIESERFFSNGPKISEEIHAKTGAVPFYQYSYKR